MVVCLENYIQQYSFEGAEEQQDKTGTEHADGQPYPLYIS